MATIGFAQDPIATQMRLNSLANPAVKLFVHFDKNVYSSNEMVWFTAYLLGEDKVNIDSHNVLSVSLIKDADSSLIVQEKFVMGQSISFGNMVIPNLLANGSYHFMVFTNRVFNGKPVAVFVQPITLITNVISPIRAKIAFQQQPKATDSLANLIVNVTTNESRFLPKPANVTYSIGNFRGTSKTDESGQLLLKIPLSAVNIDTVLTANVKYEKDSTLLKIAMPVFKRIAKVAFYPEGGYLVNKVPGYVSFEIKDQFGQPMQTAAVLFKDNKPTDTLQTSYYGMGRFPLVPEAKSRYSVKLLLGKVADSSYILPQILENGIAVSVSNAVATDTLNLTIRGNLSGIYTIRLHNFRESYSNTPTSLKNVQRLKIPLQNIPKGLFTITISDSLGRPLADRMAFAHYETNEAVKIETDKPIYKSREKVTLKLSLDSGVAEGVFSLAVVQQSRLNVRNSTDIESYAYLTSEIRSLPLNAIGIPYKDKAFLEDVLRVKGWNKYTWLQLKNVKPSDTVKNYDPLEITGEVSRNGKSLTKAVSLGITIDTAFSLLQTDENGRFSLPMDNLIAESGKKAYAFLNGGNKELLKISINDPYINLIKKNIKDNFPVSVGMPFSGNNVMHNINEKSIALNEVVIRSTKDIEKFKSNEKLILGSNECGDYLCSFGVLNCPYHSPATSPIKGRTYAVVNKINKKGYDVVLYKGCLVSKGHDISSFTHIPILNTQKEFYVNEYGENQEPALSSTLYWANYIKLNQNKDLNLTFFTDDITSKFTVILQGIANGQPVFNQHQISVTNK